MTPANLRQNNGIDLGTDDVKLKELLAKQAFMKVDDKKMQAFRNQGKTPTLTSSPNGEGELIRGELKHDLIKPTSMSPMS